MNITCKKLFVYSYCYPIFLCAYISIIPIIACKILTFPTTSGISNSKGLIFFWINLSFWILWHLRLFDLILHEQSVGGEKIWCLTSHKLCVFWRYLGGKWLYWKWNSFFNWFYIKKLLLKSLEWLGFTKYHMEFRFFPVAERLLIQLIRQRRIQNCVKYLEWSFLWK